MMEIDLESANASLQEASTETVLRWALDVFAGDIAMSSSFQTQSVPLLHILSKVSPGLPVLFLDTGFHFPETLAFRDRLAGEWGLNLVILKVSQVPEDGGAGGNGPLYLINPDMCCKLHKVIPMRQAIAGYGGWLSGIRRDQTASRANVQPVEAMADGRFRIHPMLHWTQDHIQRYMSEYDLPEHPLTAQGYTSIGCAPCTRRPLTAGDLRSGRWAESGKTECGLHTGLRDEPKETSK